MARSESDERVKAGNVISRNVRSFRASPTALFESLMGGGAGLGSGPRCDYSTLIGLPDSFAKEGAEYAMAGKVVPKSQDGYEIATFAGGCFWGIELAYQREPGVVATSVGYAQGEIEQPTYNEVCTAGTGHTEAVQVIFDPKEVSYQRLCELLLERLGRSMLLKNQVGNDRGPQYRSGIYPLTPEQRQVAEQVIAAEQENQAGPIQTEIEDAQIYWPAEEYHQQYLSKGGRFGSGQDASKGATEEIRCYG